MTDYSKTYDGATKDSSNDTILGADFDTEFTNISTMSATKADKVVGAVSGNIAELDGNGNLVDSGYAGFPSGTLMLFQQTAAPTGWTKETTHNDKALRVVSGAASSGGSVAFSTVFAKTATDSHTLTAAQSGLPAHSHTVVASGVAANAQSGGGVAGGTANYGNSGTVSAANAASGHTHNMDIQVQYVDLIICSKD